MRVLIIGLGSIGKKHRNALLQINPDVELIAFRHNLQSEISDGTISVFTKEEIFKLGPYDFVIISNPTFKHAEAIEMVLDLNCPLFIEKPLYHKMNFSSTLEKISAKKTISYVACNLRFLDSLIYLKEQLIPRLIINEVNVYCGSFLPDWRERMDYRTNYSVDALLGGGVHLDLIHEIDYTYWMFGKPIDVRSYRRSRSTLAIDAIDYANYLLEYENFAVNITLNYYRRDKKRTIELVGSEDTYIVDILSNTITSLRTDEILYSSAQIFIDTYKKQLEYFIDKIANTGERGEKMMNNIEEAFEVLKICLK